jgi:hypothetical protein
MRTELRVTWLKPRVNEPPLRCSRRVADEYAAAAEMTILRAEGAREINVVSAAEVCTCRAAPSKPETETETARKRNRRLAAADKD